MPADRTEKPEAGAADAALTLGTGANGAATRKRIAVETELLLVVALTALAYGLGVHFHWFEAFSNWVLANRGPGEMDELVVSAIVLVVGLSVFALRRWREAEKEITAHRQAQAELRLLHAELDLRVQMRTAELRTAHDLLQTELAERTRAETALRLQSAAVTAAANGIVITGRDGTIVWVNPAFTALTGYTLEEAAGKNPRDLVKSGQHDRGVYQNLWETVLAGRVWQGELVNRRKDGSLYPEEQTITPVRDDAGEITHFIAIKRDLTATKLADEMVQTSRRQFQAVFEQAAVGMVIADGDRGRFLHVNRHFCEMVGYTAEELRHLSSHDITHPDDIAVDTDQLEQINFGIVREFSREKRYRKKDGSYVWANAFVAPLDPSEARPTRRIGVIADISKRKRAEEALRQSEEHYRSLFDNMLNGYAYCRMIFVEGQAHDFTYLSVNRAFVTLTGLKEVEGKNASVVVPGLRENDQELLEIYGRVARTGVPEHFEKYVKALGMWFSISVYSPQREHFVTVFDVITERKEAEAALRLFRALLDQSSDAIEVIDPASGRFLDVNESAPADHGYSRAEYLSLRVCDLDPTMKEAGWPQQAERIRAAGSVSGEGYHRRKDGTVFPMEFSAKWVRLDRDYIVTVVRDISLRRHTEANLQASEERHRLLFENNPLPMWVFDRATLRFLAVNESAVQHYGYTRAEFLAMTIQQIRPEEDIAKLLTDVNERRAEDTSASEWRHRRKDGTMIHVEIFSRPLVFEGREARLVLASDITEKKLLEEKFLHAQRLESLGMLASGIAHDLNNVLAPIVFAAPLLRHKLSSERDLKILATLERSAERGTGLVKQILGFVHSTTGEFRPTQVKHLARDIADVIEETFPKSIQFEQRIASNLWLVLGNPTQIHQILLNLCVNARDAMPAGGKLTLSAINRRLDIEQAATLPGARPGAWLVLEVTDTGTGIAAETLAHIWDPFFTTKGEGKGTGLGLSTVRGIVASHHGFVTLETQVGHGTMFRVFLPATLEESALTDRAPATAASAGHGELVLVVDDDAAVIETVVATLTDNGYRVLSAPDGVGAVDQFIAHTGEIALVVTDVDMPLLGGAALARILVQLRSEVPLLVMSGLPSAAQAAVDTAAAKELAHAFLQKPFTTDALLATVHQLLHPTPKT